MNDGIYKSKLRTGKRTYFFDVYIASNNSKYVEITESKKKSDNEFERHSIMIFEDDIKHFKNEIIELYEKNFSS